MRKPTDTLLNARKLPHFDEFLASRKSDKTRELYGYALAHLVKFLSENADSLDRNSPWREPFSKWLVEKGFSENSIPYHLSAVSQYLKFMDGEKIVLKNTELAE